MNQNFRLIPFSLFIYLFIFLLPRKAICTSPQYLACSIPKSCGDGQNISFPFYVHGQQESFCAYPGFNLTCRNTRPILSLHGSDFIIRQIDYKNQTLRVSHAVLFGKNTSCVPQFRNISLGERFTLFRNQTELSLLSRCKSKLLGGGNSELLKYKVDCNDESKTGPTLLMLDGDPLLGIASDVCKDKLMVPVDVERGKSEGIERMLERGFLLKWTASNCSICESSGGKCGFNISIYHFKCFCPDRPHAWSCRPAREDAGKSKFRGKLGAGLAAGIGALVIILSLYIFRSYRRRKHASSNFLSTNSHSDPSSKSEKETGGIFFGLPLFSYTELEEATSNFDVKNELGDGGFGTVYYGKLRDGREVAVKRLYQHNYRRVEQFMNEIEILTRLRHKNLVTLYGCTSRRSRELLLVYEYIPNGTVADHLHGDRAKSSPLTWPIRTSIAIETASALAYLHASDTIHRDVKTNNILLDNNFCVKVADFGLSKLCPDNVTHISTAPQGTPGYVDPEYHESYQLTDKSDVYSFGVVLIELISSMPAVDISRNRREINLANLAINKIQKCEFDELIDSSFGYNSDEVVRRMTIAVAELAFRCLQQDKEMRPSMDEVLEELTRIESADYRENLEIHDENKPLRDMLPPPSPADCEDASLLKNIRVPYSPDTVTAKWESSCSTIPNVSG